MAVEELMQLLDVAHRDHCKPHDSQAAALHTVLKGAPCDAEIWDVIGLTLKACRGVGLPPAVGGCPGKQLLGGLHVEYMAAKGGAAAAAADAEEQKGRIEQWQDMSDLLARACALLFDKMSSR